jgi:hypothetical protein
VLSPVPVLRWQSAGAGAWGLWAVGLRGIGPALAGNVGAGWAFALSRDGNQGVDVPMLAPARSRCRFVDWGYVPPWGGLIVAVEEKQSSLTRCVEVMALGALGALRALGALGWYGVRSAPTGHRIPARGETPGVPHNRSVLKERRILPGAHTCFAVAECRGWRLGLVGVGAPRDRSCARRERWGRLSFRAIARRESGCRRSYARSGPVPLPLGCLGVCPFMEVV